MKIVVLDGHTLNPGDLDWSALQRLGACTIHDRSAAAQIVPRAQDAELVLTNKTPLSSATLAELPKLRYIGVLATGYNVVDVPAAKARGIVVTNVPDYGTRSVAQHVFALLLELTQNVGHHAQTVREGRWNQSLDFCYWDRPLVELAGLKLGIVGYGRIGRAVAEIGRAFGMEILVSSRSEQPGVTQVSMEELFRLSDVISLHCPLTAENKGMINASRLRLMKPGAFLINTSRGPLVIEQDLAEALNAGRIAGAALDVLAVEPPPNENPLFRAKNCVITPHIAWATRAARDRLLGIAIANVAAFQAGRPQNVVH
ncbi:MAG TPA: D-2-hydroxyacid dehydrogenase [Opitutus sp.]|nr:D-2-hydroxyacid dehydrogenase [Opitutus sp.]